MKTKIFTLLLLAFIGLSTANAQVGIGTITPDASAALDVVSTTKGFLPPRLTTAQRDAIVSPAEGLTIFNTTVGCLQFFNGTGWFNVCDGSISNTPGAVADCATPGFIPPFLTADQTVIVDVTNPVTGATWMDRNLGAYTADRTTPSPAGGTDCWAYGNLYQWGRGNDGHEDRTSNTAVDPVTEGNEGSDFITVGSSPFDWLSTQDDNRWNANETVGGAVVKTVNDPCPDGYRVPTTAELEAERLSWSSNNREGAINSPLKLPVAAFRFADTGALSGVGNNGHYWSSSTDSGTNAWFLYFISSNAGMNAYDRADGGSVRCIKD